MGVVSSSTSVNLSSDGRTHDCAVEIEDAATHKLLIDLPDEVFSHFSMSLAALSSLACCCRDLHQRLPDDLWRLPVREKALYMHRELIKLPLISHSRISGPSHPGGLLHDEDQLLHEVVHSVLHPVEDDGTSWRKRANLLRALSCSLCSTRGTSGVKFPLSKRGLCLVCEVDRPSMCERWRRRQAVTEEAMREEADEATRRMLLAALSSALRARLDVGLTRRSVSLRLLFDSTRGGRSLLALLRAAVEVPATILLIRERLAAETSERVFGAFVSSRWSTPDLTSFFGNRHCFLFSLTPNATCVFPVREDVNPNCVHVSLAHGLGFGGSLGCFGLQIHPELTSGLLLPSLTFGDCSRLTSSPRFEIENIQLWGFIDGALETRPRGRADWELLDSKSVTADTQNKIMLEFVHMERSIAYDARFGK